MSPIEKNSPPARPSATASAPSLCPAASATTAAAAVAPSQRRISAVEPPAPSPLARVSETASATNPSIDTSTPATSWPARRRRLIRAQARVGPCPGQLPGGREGRAHVETAVDENAGDALEAAGLAEEDTLVEPGAMGEVVRADAYEPELRGRWTGAVGVGGALRLLRDH